MVCHTAHGQLGKRARPLLFTLVAFTAASSTRADDQAAFSVLVAATDAATKQPIAEINVVPASYGDGQVHVTWQSQYRQTLTAASPVFEMQRGWQRTVLRIEVEGYTTVISGPFVKQPGQVLNLELEKDSGIVGTVLQPNGEPADGASIAVCTRTNEVYVEDGELRYGGHARRKKLDVTDQIGAFRVPSEPDEWVLVIAHDTGYAERTQPEFSESSQIRLKSWGRVEGRCIVDGQPIAEQRIDIGMRITVGPREPDDEVLDVGTLTLEVRR